MNRDLQMEQANITPGVDPDSHEDNFLRLAQRLVNDGVMTDADKPAVVHQHLVCDFFNFRNNLCNCAVRVCLRGTWWTLENYDRTKASYSTAHQR